jgi:hypothetical protein
LFVQHENNLDFAMLHATSDVGEYGMRNAKYRIIYK